MASLDIDEAITCFAHVTPESRIALLIFFGSKVVSRGQYHSDISVSGMQIYPSKTRFKVNSRRRCDHIVRLVCKPNYRSHLASPGYLTLDIVLGLMPQERAKNLTDSPPAFR